MSSTSSRPTAPDVRTPRSRQRTRPGLFSPGDPEQHSDTEVIDASVVADNGHVLHADLADRRDQIFRNAAQPEPAGGDRHVVMKQAVKRGGGVRINFAHVEEI